MYNRYISAQALTRRTPTESYHWSMALSLFNGILSRDIESSDQDALWLTTAALSWITLFAVDTADPEQVWPLKPTEASDLSWLQIQKGLHTMWPLCNIEGRPDSAFHAIRWHDDDRCLGTPTPEPGIHGIPQAFVDLYELSEISTCTNNPYHTSVRCLIPLLNDNFQRVSHFKYMTFPNNIGPAFEGLLRQKDSRALLLMALWYATVCRASWWISPRALVECRSICIYLDRHCLHDMQIQSLLTFAKQRCMYGDIVRG